METNELVYAALQAYGMADASVEFLRHNENMTYCVDEKYLLRIHKSQPGFSMDFFHNGVAAARLHESELRFLKYLHRCGLQTQMPLRNQDGEFVTTLQDGTPVTMLTWLPGKTLEQVHLTPETGYAIGTMLGKLHKASAGYQTTHGDTFGRYDHTLCGRLRRLLKEYYERDTLDTSLFMSMDMALQIISRALEACAESYILVHSDLSLSNMLLTEREIVPIDFSLQGYSTPMLDLGSLFCFIDDPDCQEQMIQGYESIMDRSVDRRLIDCCLALQILLSIALHYPLWEKEAWFQERLPVWCDEVFTPLAGE